jgi:protein-tyrosine phosphatase
MIDIHCHILPGIDDGPSDVSESLRMCKMALREGIRTIVATPHSFNGDFTVEPQKIISMVRDFNRVLKDYKMDLKLAPGMEVRVFPEFLEKLAEGMILPLNAGRYILTEFSAIAAPAGFENLVGYLLSKDYGIIIGHPEKNLEIQRNPEWLVDLVRAYDQWDIVVQIAADSILGQAGKPAYKTARFLLKAGAVHVIATDAHSSTARPPKLIGAVAAAAGVVGLAEAKKMVLDVPLAILSGGGFPSVERKANRRKWWNIF